MKKNWPWIVGGLAVATVGILYWYGKKVTEGGVMTGLREDAMRYMPMPSGRRLRFPNKNRGTVGYVDVTRVQPMIDHAMKVRRYN